MMWIRRSSFFALLFLLANSASALAADPPGRVGRLSLVDGTVSLRTPARDNAAGADNQAATADATTDEWAPATLNYPVTTGNSLWTEAGARAEVQVGSAEVRMTERSELEVMRLDDQSVELALHQGAVNLHLDALLPGGLQLDTPRGPVTFTQPGSYRVSVETSSENASDTVEVTAFDGEARISIDSADRSDIHTVKRGESLKLTGEPADIVMAQANTTSFDEWARGRDRRIAPPANQAANPIVSPALSPTVSPVSPQVTGYQDLAPYGTWEPAPSYGAVWYPTAVAVDWAPYRYGHWAYIVPWGWTWIDDAPWGFAPFHYGRWVHIGHRWAWWPGARAARPVYAPALVAFVGGDGWSVSISSGARPIGWVPLAPFEMYRPHYRTSATYVRNVNITTVNRTVINNITVNKTVEANKFVNRGAATVVASDSFAHGRKVNEARIDVPRKQFERAHVTTDERRIAPASVASRTDAPRPPAHTAEIRRAPGPAVSSNGQQHDQARGPRREPTIERRDARSPATPQNAARSPAAPQAQPQQQKQPREQRRETAPQDRQQPREQRRETAPQPAPRGAAPEPAAVPQAQPPQRQRNDQGRPDRAREVAPNQDNRAAPPQERDQRREQAPDRRPDDRSSVQPDQPLRRDAQDKQRSDQAQEQQRQALEQQKRDSQDRMIRDRQQRAQQDDARARQERQQRDAEEQQRRTQQALQRQQTEQQQRQQAEQQQRRAQAEQQQRQQAEAQQRQAQDQQRRAQAEQQQRQQADTQQRQTREQQQRQAQEQQRRAQAEQQQQRQQADQPQRQQQPEQAREERRRGDGKRDRPG